MNKQQQNTQTLLIASLLAFALLTTANISAPQAVFATGGLDDEEEEDAIEELKDAVDKINDKLGTIELNLTTGANDITANCPNGDKEENNTQTPEEPTPVQPTCPLAPVPEPEPETPPTTAIPELNVTCSIQEPEQPAEPATNVTEEVEEIIENVTQGCGNTPPPTTAIPPGIVLPNVTEPEDPPQNNVTDPDEVPICPITGLPIGQTPTPAAQEPQQQQEPAAEQQTPVPQIQDEQEVASIEFESDCGCFVVDKSPEEVQQQ